MRTITLKEAEKLSSPNPFALVSTIDRNGKNNLMALSWWTYCSNNPPTVAVCLSNKGYSGGLIREPGEFALCLPDETLREAAFRCGTCSGRDTEKAEAFGIKLADSEKIRPKLVAASKIVMECVLVSETKGGDHTLFLAEVVAVHAADEDRKHLLSMDGYGELRAF